MTALSRAARSSTSPCTTSTPVSLARAAAVSESGSRARARTLCPLSDSCFLHNQLSHLSGRSHDEDGLGGGRDRRHANGEAGDVAMRRLSASEVDTAVLVRRGVCETASRKYFPARAVPRDVRRSRCRTHTSRARRRAKPTARALACAAATDEHSSKRAKPTEPMTLTAPLLVKRCECSCRHQSTHNQS